MFFVNIIYSSYPKGEKNMYANDDSTFVSIPISSVHISCNDSDFWYKKH